jgi:hypothetical protein
MRAWRMHRGGPWLAVGESRCGVGRPRGKENGPGPRRIVTFQNYSKKFK